MHGPPVTKSTLRLCPKPHPIRSNSSPSRSPSGPAACLPAWCAGLSSHSHGLAQRGGRPPTAHSSVLVVKPQLHLCSLLHLPSLPSFPLPTPPSSALLLLLHPLPLPSVSSPPFSLWEGPLATQLITTAGASGLLLQPFPWMRAQYKQGCCISPASPGPPTAQGWWADEVIGVGGGWWERIFVWSCFRGNLLDPSSTPLIVC